VYNRKGFVTLSRLWRDFESGFLPRCKTSALACMEADPHSSNLAFGTALDLCEDVFLRTFDTFQLSLVPLQGEVIQVEPVLAHSGARLLLKATAFESAHISMFPDEAGPDGKWLKQMGSSAFRAADIGWLWPDMKGRSTGIELEKILFANVFNTLPILFERPTFIIAKKRPPWSYDLLEESYVRNLWQETRGSAICLSDDSADIWKKSLTKQNVETILSGLIPNVPAGAIPESRPTGGRPPKLTGVIRAYRELGLMNENLTRKAAQKDTSARWTLKIGGKVRYRPDGTPLPMIATPVFDYKSHISIDRRFGFIRESAVTSAASPDGRMLRQLLSDENTSAEVWADTAYRSQSNEKWLAKNDFISSIHRRKPHGKPMPKRTRAANFKKSSIRARVEHVFAHQKNRFGLFIRSIGLARAEAKLTLLNLAYKFDRLVFHERQNAMG